MTRPKNVSRYPVSSFGPELMAVLIEGTKREVRIPFPDRRTMRAFQQRIHMLRGAMGREKHPQYATVTRARTSQSWKISDNNGEPYDWALLIRPQDSQFADAIKKAGVEITPADGDLLLDSVAPPAPSNEPATVAVDELPLSPYERFKS